MGTRILEQTILIDEGAEAKVAIDPKFGDTYTGGAMVAVSINADGEAILPTTDGEKSRGFATRKAAAGEDVQIMLEGMGPVKVKTAAGISKYTALRANDDGTVSAAGDGNEIVAYADAVPGADGDVIQARVSTTFGVFTVTSP